MKIRLSVLASAIALLSTGLAARASSITYTLTNVGLTNGVGGAADGTLNGTFTFNTTTNTVTAADIVASAGVAPASQTGGGYEYIYGGAGANSTAVTGFSTFFILGSIAIPNNQVELAFNNVLNGSGPDSFSSASLENELTLGVRNVSTSFSATIGAAAAPEPSSIVLLGTGVLSLGGLVRRRLLA